MTPRTWPLERAVGVATLVAVGACMLLPQSSVLRPLAAGVLGVVLAFAGWYLAVVVWQGLKHHRLVRQVGASSEPGVESGIAVRRTNRIHDPFVAGLRQPEIFCPADLADRVAADEIRAVLLHEDHHRRTRAPVRLLLVEALATAFPLPAVRWWAVRTRASIEIDADRHALAAGADRSAIAAALLGLSAGAPPGTAGFATAAELRVRALLGDHPLGAPQRGSAAFALAAVAISLACLAFYLR
jgi:beta-lactamase regulating signal transducer with metallopeptidase domain